MEPIADLVATTLAKPAPPEITAVATCICASHTNVQAVLAYGSCLRGVAATESLIDLYLLTDGYHGVSASSLSRLACRLVAPNVYYAECAIGGTRYRVKYAVLPLARFARAMTAANPYFWARFAQPAALVYANGESSRDAVIAACATAVTTMYAHARGLAAGEDLLQTWASGFAATYATELRAEAGPARARQLVEANRDYYVEAARRLVGVAPRSANWRRKRIAGKCWAVLRLVKASFTFAGGADYLAWKIERHTGQKIVLAAWQRRHPVVAGLLLLPRLMASRAVR
jgi:hypothetical protein